MKNLFTAFCFGACCFSTTALADVSRNQCQKDASKAFQTAVSVAHQTLNEAKLACKGPCNENCRTAETACVGPFKTAAQDCLNHASETFNTALLACKTSTNCGTDRQCFRNKTFQTCLIDPRVARRTAEFACLTAEATAIKGAACESTFSACKKACKAAEGSSN